VKWPRISAINAASRAVGVSANRAANARAACSWAVHGAVPASFAPSSS
jgi:hypothetical protein